MLWLLLALLALAGIIATVSGDAGSIFGLDTTVLVPALVSATLLLFMGSSLLSGYRGRLAQGAKDALTWLVIAFVLVLGYSYRDTVMTMVERVKGELAPPGEAVTVEAPAGERAVRLRRRSDGHFVAKAQINGATASLLVDTGASAVVLTQGDARLAGIDVQKLSYSVPVRTANGVAYAASVRLRSVTVGSVVISNVDALVSAPGALGQSLLGMTFLTRLRSYEVSGEYMTLRI